MRKLRVIAIALALFAFVGCEGQETQTDIGEGAAEVQEETEEAIEETGDYFGQWDMDQQRGLSREEFVSGFEDQGLFGDWDADGDDFLNQEDFNNAFGDEEWFNEGLFDEWDANGDGNLTSDETYEGLFGEWDMNDNDMIEENEFHGDFF